MKKTLSAILLGAFATMVIAAPAFAATSVSFMPVDVSVRQGQTLTLVIGINPEGVKNYTAKMELRYPAGLLEVKSFTFANSWMPLSQSEYDVTDNTNGVLIKTAGYPGGVSGTVTFGTVSFLAKKSGNGAVTLSSDSFILNGNNQNVLDDTSVKTMVAISTPSVTTPKAPVSSPKPEEPIVQEQPTVSEPITPQSLLAAAGTVVTLGTNNFIVGLSIMIVILILAVYATYAVIQRARRKN